MNGWKRAGLVEWRFIARASVWSASGFTGALASGHRLPWGEPWRVAAKGKWCCKHAQSKRWRDF
jgi:hypothetical protein